MAHRGLSGNEIAGALISMMARSKRSNQRPDTLMQDRYRQIDELSCDARPDHTLGQVRPISNVRSTSALPLIATRLRKWRHFASGPFSDIVTGVIFASNRLPRS